MRTRASCPNWPETDCEWFALVLAGFKRRSKALSHKLTRLEARIEERRDDLVLLIEANLLSTRIALTLWPDRVGCFQAFRGSKDGWLTNLQQDAGPFSSEGLDVVVRFEEALKALDDADAQERIWSTEQNQGVGGQPATPPRVGA